MCVQVEEGDGACVYRCVQVEDGKVCTDGGW